MVVAGVVCDFHELQGRSVGLVCRRSGVPGWLLEDWRAASLLLLYIQGSDVQEEPHEPMPLFPKEICNSSGGLGAKEHSYQRGEKEKGSHAPAGLCVHVRSCPLTGVPCFCRWYLCSPRLDTFLAVLRCLTWRDGHGSTSLGCCED